MCGPRCKRRVLGLSCPPGGAEQRIALRRWPLEHFTPPATNEQNVETYVDRLLDELFQGSGAEVIASATDVEINDVSVTVPLKYPD